MYLSLCSVSVIGPRNLREKKSNQDAVIHRYWEKNWCITVCDGMGSGGVLKSMLTLNEAIIDVKEG